MSDEIRDEHARTDYILKHGFLHLLASAALELLRAPMKSLSALKLATQCGWPGLKGRLWPYAYYGEACYLSRRLREKNVDHLHNHIGDGCAFVAMLASALSDVPFSLTIHGPYEFDEPALLAISEKVSRSEFTIAISEFGLSQLFRWTAAADWTKIHLVRCGVRFDSAPSSQAATHRRIICVGRLCSEKGHLILVEAMARLGTDAAFEVVLVGDGPLRREIEERARSLGIGDRLKMTGWMPAEKIRDELLRSDALVLPSFAEGLPVVIMEAFALERPVIATSIAGIPELVKHGISGWLIPAGSIDSLTAAMREVLSTPAGRLSEMGRAGSMLVREHHDQIKQARKLEALIESTRTS